MFEYFLYKRKKKKRKKKREFFKGITSIYYHMVEFNYGQERESFILDFPI